MDNERTPGALVSNAELGLVEKLRALAALRKAAPLHDASSTEAVWLEQAADRLQRLEAVLSFVSTASTGGEVFPCGPADTVFAEDGNTVVQHVGPWYFVNGTGPTFLDAVEDAMRKA